MYVNEINLKCGAVLILTKITKIHANLVFKECISFLRCFRKGNLRKCWQVPISFYKGVSRFRGVSDKSGAFLFLPCSHKNAVARMKVHNQICRRIQ